MNKYSPEEKVRLIKQIIEQRQSINSLATIYGIGYTVLKEWVRNY